MGVDQPRMFVRARQRSRNALRDRPVPAKVLAQQLRQADLVRAEVVDTRVRPALREGSIVIMRFYAVKRIFNFRFHPDCGVWLHESPH